MASNIEQSASDLFGAGEIPAERRFFSLAPGGMGAGMTIGDRYNHLLRLQKERAEVLSDMAGAQRSELDLMKTTQEMVNIRNRHNVLDELDKLSFRDDDLPDKLAQFDRAQLMDPVVARKVSNLSGKHANYQQANTQIVQSLFDAGVPRGSFFDDQYSRAKDMLNSYDTEGLAKFFANANRAKAVNDAKKELDLFERKERFKHDLTKSTNLDSDYETLLKDIRVITKDSIPSYIVERYPDQFIEGLPFEPDAMSTTVRTGENKRGEPVTKEVITMVPGHHAVMSDHVKKTFNSYIDSLIDSAKVETTTDEDGVTVRKLIGKDKKGNQTDVNLDRLDGLYLPNTPEKDTFVDVMSRKAWEFNDPKAFVAWGLNENSGIKATVQKIVEDQGEGAEDTLGLLVNILDSIEDSVDPATTLLTEIHRVVHGLKQFDQRTAQAFQGQKGKALLEIVRQNRTDASNIRTRVNEAMDENAQKVTVSPGSFVPSSN